MTVLVASFNIRFGTAPDGDHSWTHRRENCLGVLQEMNADLIALQEVLSFQLEEIREALPAYGAFGVGREDGIAEGEFSPCLYRADRFDLLDAETLWLSERPHAPGVASWESSHQRICTVVTLVEKLSGEKFRFASTHWDHVSLLARQESAKLTNRLVLAKGEPCILAGDFNAEWGEGSLEILEATSARVSTGLPAETTFQDFMRVADGPEIDHVFFTAPFEASAFGVVQSGTASDHYPVLAMLSTPASLRS